MDVYLDSAPENITPELAPRPERVLDDRWNGWLRPLATAEAFGAFLDAWRCNDPNGTWGYHRGRRPTRLLGHRLRGAC
ncbi:hypothetical protein GHK92_15675 [Nocardioides sp. dk4132]|uniref:hypothetical protein n=1 Tax=unclassified Nocardioides TaxID=2615069 RepID=UPI00129796DF|nr:MULTISPECIES: hypothetical protein [unclassified Nocardioides]MQW77313.1 hypothetical protein [Nocardioides sp. dk4132]QGA08066.1 hypothetical protein GFH29_12145 [Nocardioides sp. dk884]